MRLFINLASRFKTHSILIILFFGIGCTQKSNVVSPVTNISFQSNINEASYVANAFFKKHIGLCGATEDPFLVGRYWVSHTRVGYAGNLGQPIKMDLEAGLLYWKNRAYYIEEKESIFRGKLNFYYIPLEKPSLKLVFDTFPLLRSQSFNLQRVY